MVCYGPSLVLCKFGLVPSNLDSFVLVHRIGALILIATLLAQSCPCHCNVLIYLHMQVPLSQLTSPRNSVELSIAANSELGSAGFSEPVTVTARCTPDTPAAPITVDRIAGMHKATSLHILWEEPKGCGEPITKYQVR